MIDYLQWKRQTTKNANTVVNYERWVRRFYTWLGRETCDFTLEDVLRFREWLASPTPKRKAYSPKNIQYGLTLLRDYISYQNTVHGFEFPLRLLKIPQERSKSHYAVTYEEYRKMVDLLATNEPLGIQRRLMLDLLWETGMRVGELLRLRLSDLGERGATIHNEKNHRNRIIGWSQQTENLFKFYLPFRKNLESKEDWLFVSFFNKPCRKFTTRNVELIVKGLREEAGIMNPIRPHSFRHAFVHRHLKAGKPITTIAQMLGHSTVFNVLAYAQLSGQEIQEAWKM
jgi:integrase/recombinase XerD